MKGMIGGLVAGVVMLGTEGAWAQITYQTAIFAAANEYCSQIDSGNRNRQAAFQQAITNATKLYIDLVKNDPVLFDARVRDKIDQQCPDASKITRPEDKQCPGLTHAQIRRIAAGQRVTVLGPGCLMQFH
jgi:hypothetical protein